MSLKQSIQFTCPKCGLKQPFTIWQSLNASVDPEARTKLIDGKLLEFVCGRCAESVIVNYPLLYHDSERHFMIWLTSEEDPDSLPSAKSFPFGGIAQNYILRVVNEGRTLIEKIRAFEAELDDRLIELAKAIVQRNLADSCCETIDTILFLKVDQTETGAKTISFDVVLSTESRNHRVAFDLYKVLALKFGSQIGPVLFGKWLKIDRPYAIDIIVNHEQ